MASLFTLISGTDSIQTALTAGAAGDEFYIMADYDGTGDAGAISTALNQIKIYGKPTVTVAQDITFTGDNCSLIGMPGATFAEIKSTGTGNYVFLHNGATAERVQQITTGQALTLRGGGYGAQVRNVNFTRPRCIVENISIDSKTVATGLDAISISEAECKVFRVNIIDSDRFGIILSTANAHDCQIKGCTIQDSDLQGIVVQAPRAIISANHVLATTSSTAIDLSTANADNCVIDSNYFNSGRANPVDIDPGAANCIVTCNRMVDQDAALGGTGTIDQDNNRGQGLMSLHHGSIYIDTGVTTQTTNATPGTYDVMTGWNTAQGADGISSSGVTPAKASNKITIVETGIYSVEFLCSFSGTGNSTFELQGYLGGVAQAQLQVQRKLGTGGDVGSAGFSGTIDVTSGSTDIDIRVASDGVSDSFTPVQANLKVTRVFST